MPQLRFKGPQSTTAFNLADATIAGQSDNENITSWLAPAAVSGRPVAYNATTSGKQRDGETLSLLTNGLTGITAYQWKSDGVNITGETGSTYVADDAGDSIIGTYVTCEVTCNEGVLTSPGVLIYSDHAMAGHNTDDDAILAVTPHEDTTHLAIADGDWSSAATWLNGDVPYYGAVALIPNGVTVTYDIASVAPRLDRVRVDGELAWATDQSTEMLAESLIGSRGSTIRIATSSARLSSTYTAEIVTSDRNYLTDSRVPTDIDITRDARLWGRGVVTHGTLSVWGAEKTSWLRTAIDTAPMTSDTSVILETAPTGWEIGDTLVIPGTALTDASGTSETETRIVTGVSGATISFNIGLSNDHDKQNAASGRTDLQPAIGNLTRNIVFRSETPAGSIWRRGHMAVGHGASRADIWDCEFSGLGRTQKTPSTPAGLINGNGDFLYVSGSAVENSAVQIDVDASAGTFTRASGSWITDGFVIGSVFTGSGFANAGNQAEKEVSTVTATVITVTDNTGLVTETGSGNESLTGTAFAETLTAQSNIQSRYPCHLHHVGFGKTNRDVVVGCAVHDSPGWAMVHHACEADFIDNVMYDFSGAGMVSESANEVGAWTGNLAVYSTEKTGSTAKNAESPEGKNGDFFKHGWGFAMRGRALRSNRNVAADVSTGFVFYHRDDEGETIAGHIDHTRSTLDLQDLQGPRSTSALDPVEFPIIHFADNEAVATFRGLFVTKEVVAQEHGLNINLKRFLAWGYREEGCDIEYVSSYVMTDFDALPSDQNNGTTRGVKVGNNTYQMAVVRPRTEDCDIGVYYEGGEIYAADTDYTPNDDPKYILVAHESIGDTTGNQDDSTTSTLAVHTTEPTQVDASTDLAFEIAHWDGTSSYQGGMTNQASGDQTDTQSALHTIPKPHDNVGLVPASSTGHYSTRCDEYQAANGYYQYGGNNVIVFPMYFGDRIYAVPQIKIHAIRNTGSVAGDTDNGTYTVSANAPSVSAAVLTTSVDTAGTLDVIALATDADSDSMSLHDSFYNADHGVLEIDQPTSGDVRYTPDPGFVGTDVGYVFVSDGAGHMTTVKLDIRVGVTASQAIVASDWSIANATGDAIDFILGAAPDTGNRRIIRTEYTTDGISWRRLCYKWIPGTHNVTLESDGTTIPGSTTYNTIQIRYLTDLGDTLGSDTKSTTTD